MLLDRVFKESQAGVSGRRDFLTSGTSGEKSQLYIVFKFLIITHDLRRPNARLIAYLRGN
ncbi:hypothetical protein MmTuc01_2890 [Methanosarcina mazei Tuc01]|jgi:hypothetical protein|nr:hypothetical protein MmTuc01_2890 [Methanosarcina mazei Tuc01]